jgi:hypothetical protein
MKAKIPGKSTLKYSGNLLPGNNNIIAKSNKKITARHQ